MTNKLDIKDVKKSFWRWTFFSHSNYNYERMQSSGFLHCLRPSLRKLYTNEDELRESYKRHLEFFNTEPHFGGIIGGLTLALEEQKANGADISGEDINSIKTGLMGPLAGVGDTLWQGTIVPILLSLAVGFSNSGNLIGPIFYIIAMCLIMFSIAYYLWMKGYKEGSEGIQNLMSGNLLQQVMDLSKIMGTTVIGALTANYVKLSSIMEFEGNAGLNISLQENVLDQLFKGILPLSITLLSYYLLKKNYKSTTVIIILSIIAIVGVLLGVF